MKNTMYDLRNHLFEVIEGLKDVDNPMDIERARAVGNIAGKLIESAKVECKFIELTGATTNSPLLSVAAPKALEHKDD